MNSLPEGTADELSGRIAQQPFDGRTDIGHRPVCVRGVDDIVEVLDEALTPQLALAHQFFYIAALGNFTRQAGFQLAALLARCLGGQ